MFLKKFFKKEKPINELYLHNAIVYSVVCGNFTFVLQWAKQYKDRTDICVARVSKKDDGGQNIIKKDFSVPYNEQKNLTILDFDGMEFFWDYRDHCLRCGAEYDETKVFEVNKWFHIIDKEVVRVEKKYAELNLTPVCIEYAYGEENGCYLWNISDFSALPVIVELYRLILDCEEWTDWDKIVAMYYERFNELATYCTTYNNEFEKKYLIDYDNMKDAVFMFKRFKVKELYNRQITDIE